MEIKKVKWVVSVDPFDVSFNVTDSFVKEVDQKCSDKLSFEVMSSSEYVEKYAPDSSSNPRNILHLIGKGDITMGILPTEVLADINKDLDALQLPFIFDSISDAYTVLNGEAGSDLLVGVENKVGIKALKFTFSNGANVIASKVKCDTLTSFKDKKIKTGNNSVSNETFKSIESTPVHNIEYQNIVSSAKFNIIDSAEIDYFNLLPLIKSKSFKYVSDTEHSLSLGCIVINKMFFDELDDETKEALLTASTNAAFVSMPNLEAIKTACQTEGIEIVELTQEEKDKIKQATSSVYGKYNDVFSEGLIDKLKS
jgi:C4-dicarboxylate-binding protein DctP